MGRVAVVSLGSVVRGPDDDVATKGEQELIDSLEFLRCMHVEGHLSGIERIRGGR
jgi:hypothetical protein